MLQLDRQEAVQTSSSVECPLLLAHYMKADRHLATPVPVVSTYWPTSLNPPLLTAFLTDCIRRIACELVMSAKASRKHLFLDRVIAMCFPNFPRQTKRTENFA